MGVVYSILYFVANINISVKEKPRTFLYEAPAKRAGKRWQKFADPGPKVQNTESRLPEEEQRTGIVVSRKAEIAVVV
jgi:hypothetical protein